MRAIFKKLDIDGDGKLTPKEIMTFAEKFGLHPKEETINEAFNMHNFTGKLEIPESLFLIILGLRLKIPIFEKELKKIFKAFDTDNDGFLSLQELQVSFEKLSMANKEECFALFQKFDINKDNKLDLCEFKALIKSNCTYNLVCQSLLIFMKRCPYKEAFRRIDLNGDGKIAPEELKMFAEKLGLKLSIEKCIEHLKVVNPLHKPEIDMPLFVHELQDRMTDKTKNLEIKKFFHFVDTNHDGKLGVDEILDFITGLGLKYSREKVASGIKAYDADNDGKINAMEFVDFLALHEKVRIGIHTLLLLSQDCPYMQAFKFFDLINDGKICVEELVEVSKRLKFNWTEEQAKKVLCELNPLGIPELSDDCFYMILYVRTQCPCAEIDLLKMFKIIDTDHNGYITARELYEFVNRILPEKAIKYETILREVYKFDNNGDLKISPSEFMYMVSVHPKVKIAMQALLMFQTAGECGKCCEKKGCEEKKA